MGEQQAAITLAAIYQRQEQINSAGGYLRSLTERARDGKFSVWPMVMALLRAKLNAAKATGGQEEAVTGADEAVRIVRTAKRLEVSDALRRRLEKPDER
jgi:replication initiation protein RepC